MAINITAAEVKRKCMIPASDTTHDSDVDALITEMKPSIEYTISETYLNDTGNANLQATLKLGILEIISGEFLRQLLRESGASESFKIGGITVGEGTDQGLKLIEQGEARLHPFRKPVEGVSDDAGIAANTIGIDRVFSDDTMKDW